MSNSLVSVDCPQESWINHLSPNINEHMTQISTSELEFTAEPFSYTYDQEKRLSVSTMPIFPIFDASQNEEIHRETLRRNTVPDILPSQLCQFGNFFQRPIPFMPDYQDQSRINLMTYLSENILLPAKVSEESSISNTMFKHSWTDIGQIREWESFSLEEFNKMPSFQSLLNRSLPSSDLSTPSRNCNTSDFNGEYFAAKINLALSQSQKPRNLKMLVSKNQKTKESIFLSSCVGHNGTSGNDHRIVGLRKHLNGWDLLCEEESSKVKKNIDYLESLAHLHYYLREYGCRYGFILTDLNLIVVRHGTEETPNFGFLETKIFSLDSSKITEFDKSRAPNELIPQNRENLAQKGPALLALWYLHMLAGDRVIPGHASWDIDTGSYSNKSKHRFLRRDVDLLKILDADVRRAKRRKGWTTPWEIKAPRSRQRITASTQHPSREMANNKDASRKNLKNNPESIETRPYKKH
ncbi:putative sialidase protein [Erysiphe necator]|uniref:Putative sialidase protein n=1 Tax=Uncinula necator TaxID=52586 RepID=A0A0B1P609_UNCNE|nr:putative sialidase protein [Erysiphe necator]